MKIEEFKKHIAPLMRKGWVAMDKNGVWYWYITKPKIFEGFRRWDCGQNFEIERVGGLFEVDDIFYRYRNNPQIVIEITGVNSLTGYSPKEQRIIGHIANICCKIGILGVTHELVNERLINE